MKRLTKRDANGEAHRYGCRHVCVYCCNCDCDDMREMVERLAAYEDSGLTPAEVEATKLAMMGKSLAEITEFNGLPLSRLIDLAEADKDGRVWILPERWTVGQIDSIMALAERVRASRALSNSDDDKPIITWQLYNMLAQRSRAEAALAGKEATDD